jgi:asparagine synthase (glutamine-hydrolysing)
MCGILGVFDRTGVQVNRPLFDLALSKLAARGPDDAGEWSDSQIWFGHKRLAVIDTSMAGHQPMESPSGRYVIVFNGAIYNHLKLREQLDPGIKWRGQCDTETLLAAYEAWGAECLGRLEGMFAFAVWDKLAQSLFLARDRLGVKPLYYGWDGRRLVFASRPTAAATLLPKDKRGFSAQALRSYLEMGFIPVPYSLYDGLRKMPPGHYARCDAQGIRLSRYWDYRHITPDTKLRDEEELVDELQSIVDTTVKDRLLCDVPLGAFLSSGVDSAIIVAAMRRVSGDAPRAFTVSFSESKFDEGPGAAAIAKHLGADLSTLKMDSNTLLGMLPQYIHAADEPIADSAGIATLALAKLARPSITVALSGDGGDEFFSGYPHYNRLAQVMRLAELPRFAKQSIKALCRHVPNHNLNLLSGALEHQDPVAAYHYLRSMSKDFPELLQPDVINTTFSSREQFVQSAASFAMDLPVQEIAMRLDIAHTLPELYLQKMDIATMACSLETREPLVDHRLAEWAMRLPQTFKAREGTTKYLLKKLLCRSLPAEMVYRPKKGFSVPIGIWLERELKSWAIDLLHDPRLTQQLPIDWQQVYSLFEMQRKGRRNTYPLIWSILMLLSFVREHGDLEAQSATLKQVA